MAFSIYHCIRSFLPEEGSQVVNQINKAAQDHTEAISSTLVADRWEVSLVLYLEEKSWVFPQVGLSHLDSVIRLYNTCMRHLPQL